MCSRSGMSVDEGLDVERVRARAPAGHLPVEDRRRDVGVVGRELTPALVAIVGRTRTTPTKLLQNVSIAAIFTPLCVAVRQ